MIDNPEIEANRLINELATFCGSQGWDFYGAIFIGPNRWMDHWTEGGNNFIRQCTILSCKSQALQMFLSLPFPETSDIDDASALKK